FTTALWLVRNVDIQRFGDKEAIYLIPMVLGLVCLSASTFYFLRTFRGGLLSFIVAFIMFFSGGNLYNANGGFLRYRSNRFLVGVIIIAWLGIAFLLRWNHSRKIVNQAERDARDVPPELGASVRKACKDADDLGQAALAERWLMLHAVLALAVDPNQVQVDHI